MSNITPTNAPLPVVAGGGNPVTGQPLVTGGGGVAAEGAAMGEASFAASEAPAGSRYLDAPGEVMGGGAPGTGMPDQDRFAELPEFVRRYMPGGERPSESAPSALGGAYTKAPDKGEGGGPGQFRHLTWNRVEQLQCCIPGKLPVQVPGCGFMPTQLPPPPINGGGMMPPPPGGMHLPPPPPGKGEQLPPPPGKGELPPPPPGKGDAPGKPTQVGTPPKAEKPKGDKECEEKTHTVRRGDTLACIAEKHGLTWQQLFQENRDQIKNPNLIFPGQKLRIPNCDVKAPPQQTPPPSKPHDCPTPPGKPTQGTPPPPNKPRPRPTPPGKPTQETPPPPPSKPTPPGKPTQETPPPPPSKPTPPGKPTQETPPPPPSKPTPPGKPTQETPPPPPSKPAPPGKPTQGTPDQGTPTPPAGKPDQVTPTPPKDEKPAPPKDEKPAPPKAPPADATPPASTGRPPGSNPGDATLPAAPPVPSGTTPPRLPAG